MGKGHTTRMNDVLRSFMLARLSGLISGKDTLEEYRPWNATGARPEFGEFEGELHRESKMREMADESDAMQEQRQKRKDDGIIIWPESED